jgi:branched-chain amino acid aminotransferase
MARWVFFNNDFVAEEKACIHFRDLSFQRGYGIFDFFRLQGNEPLFLEDHLDRFYFSAEAMRLPVPFDREDLKNSIFELIRKNAQPNTGVRLSLTGGFSEDDFSIGKPALLVSQHSFTPPTAEQIQQGIRLFTFPYQRSLPHIKSINYLMAVWLQPQKIAAGADDILYHQNGFISECPRSNFFLVKADETIVTPSENALAGITRKKLLQLAREHFAVEERPVLMKDLQAAREAFITSTTKQILPVAAIDSYQLPQRKVSLKLLQLFQSAYGNG